MKFKVEKVSDWDYEEIKEFSTLEELLSWVDTLRYPDSDIPCGITLDRDEEDWKIHIYDDYLE